MNKKIISVLTFLFTIPFCGYGRLVGKARVDSLLQELAHVKADSTKLKVLSGLSYDYADFDADKGLRFAEEALQLARVSGADKNLPGIYNCFARNFLVKTMPDSALHYNLKALQIFENAGNKMKTALTLGFVALDYKALSDFPQALEYQFRALKKFEELKDQQFIARTLLNIGNLYSDMGEAKAIDYHLDALRLYEQIGDKDGVALCYLNLGASYYQQDQFEKALDHFLKALKLSQAMGATKPVQIEIANIGSTYLALGDLPLALNYTFESLRMSRETGDRNGMVSAYADIGRAYLALAKGDHKGKLPDSLAGVGRNEFLMKSISYLSTSLQSNDDHGNRVSYYEGLKSLSEAYDLSGNIPKAFETYKLFTQLRDSVFSEDARIKIARQETKREADLKEKQIEINALSKANTTRRMEFLLAGIGVLLIVTVVVARANKKLTAEKRTSEKLRSELEETLEQKEHLVQKLSDAADMKSRFFANVSHELRTPVTILTGMLDLMKRKGGEGVEKNKLEIALGNSRRLQMMVEEMLDISKHENPGSETRYEIKDIARVVERITTSMSAYVQQSKIRFSFEPGDAEGVFVSTDEEKLEKIITNLIYNAIKFNREGGSIKVSLSLSEDKKWVDILVKDTGLGIDEADMPHIFDRYYQSNSSNAKAKGVGIGLSLVRELTDLLGGKVSASSKVGKGTSFTLTFPVFEGQVNETLADPDDFVIADVNFDFATPYTILLVEDNTEMRYYIKEILSGNVRVVEMANGKDALDWLKADHADMVISDIMMPEMDGWEFISVLKNDSKFKTIPVIAISALSDQVSQLSLLRLGIDDYIVKPFNAIELRIRVRNLLGNLEERRKHEELPEEPGDVPQANVMVEEFKTKLQQCVLAKMKKSEVTVADVASEFSLGERQLHRLAKSLTGCTPAQLIKEVKLQKAYEMVTNREVSKVETLAKEVGFENISYFTKLFAERFGKKPSEFF